MSSSKLRRDFARGWSNQRRLVARTAEASVESALDALLSVQNCEFVQYYSAWHGSLASAEPKKPKVQRQRDIFPLPPLGELPLDAHICHSTTCLKLTNLCLAALNALASDMRPKITIGDSAPTAAQKSVQVHVAGRCNRLLLQFAAAGGSPWRGSFQHFEETPSSKHPRMQADAVDLPAKAATCDPLELLPAELASAVVSTEKLFPNPVPTPCRPCGGQDADRDEYIKLVLRQLECGKTVLRRDCQAVGDVFCVQKASPSKQREVWNGSLVSQAAAPPPKPYKLANPGCFVDLCFQDGEEVFMSKRDIHTCFDVLKAPENLQQWFGRPPVSLQELSRVGKVPWRTLQKYVAGSSGQGLSRFALLYPTSTVWPMGFSWSSCVAQACTVACCVEAGVNNSDFLTLDSAPPYGQEACGVATDDTFFFHKDRRLGQERLRRLDAVLDSRGLPKNSAKDVTLQTSMTALGCELTSQPPAVEPSASKLRLLFTGLVDACVTGRATPAGLGRLLGLAQWFCLLLTRPMYSIFDDVYSFVQREPACRVQAFPAKVISELVVTACLPRVPAKAHRL